MALSVEQGAKPTVDLSGLLSVLRGAIGDGYLAGRHAGGLAIRSVSARRVRAAMVINEPPWLLNIDWEDWEPGDNDAAIALAAADGSAGLAGLLDDAGVTIKGLEGTTVDRLGDTLAEGMAAGENLASLSRRVVDVVGDPSRGDIIARTESARAASVASMDAFADNGIAQVQWEVGDESCDICDDNDGEIVGLGDAFPSGDSEPPAHPNCFPAGTIVSGARVVGSTARWYSGELIEITTVSGRFLAVTPNHPVLTPHGFVAAGHLDEGCEVVSSIDSERVARGADPYGHHGPAPIEDVAVSLVGTPTVAARGVPVAPEDFHGDGRGSEICVVWADGELWRRFDSASSKPAGHLPLIRRDADPPLLTSLRAPTQLLNGDGATAHGGLRRRGPLLAFGRGKAGLVEPLLVADRADGDLATREEPRESRATDADFAGQFLDRFSFEVAADKILTVGRRPFAGHVYNLETAVGWYIANGIVTHNCRCTVLPYVE